MYLLNYVTHFCSNLHTNLEIYDMPKSQKSRDTDTFSENIGGGQRVKMVYMCNIIDPFIVREKGDELMCVRLNSDWSKEINHVL